MIGRVVVHWIVVAELGVAGVGISDEGRVERAVARSEVPPGTDAMRLLIAATAPVYQHLILFRDTPTLQQVDRYA